MGNLSSCCLPKKSDDEINERTHILDNPISSPEGFGQDSRYTSSPSIVSPTYGAVNGRTEQNQLNNTLHKLVAKVIDVSAIDNKIEQSDWLERQRLYGQRLQQIKRPLVLRSKHAAQALSQAPIITRSLTPFEPIGDEDVNLINELSARASDAVHQGFKVRCEESFVVQFDP